MRVVEEDAMRNRDGEARDPREAAAAAALLAAVTEADEDGPLPGEEAAVAAFRAVRAEPAARQRFAWLRPGQRGRTVTFAMACAALLTSGVAVAAGATGHMTLPLPFRHTQPAESPSATPPPSHETPPPSRVPSSPPTSGPAPAPSSATPSGPAKSQTSADDRSGHPSHGHGPTHRPSGHGKPADPKPPQGKAKGHEKEPKETKEPQRPTKPPRPEQPNEHRLDAQCRAYGRHPDHKPPAPLTEAAGGPENVDEFCAGRGAPDGSAG